VEPLRTLQASVEVAAPPLRVWDVVSDVRRTGEWSPECRKVVPLGAVGAGTWLLGLNRRGAVRWPTLSRVVRHAPPSEISWRVTTNRAVWTYRAEPTATGTRLEQTRETPEGVTGFAAWFTRRLLGGQQVHDDELEAGMTAGLHRIRELVEAP
jgi:Polyketide cyclase / dehydrase and lipid transport